MRDAQSMQRPDVGRMLCKMTCTPAPTWRQHKAHLAVLQREPAEPGPLVL